MAELTPMMRQYLTIKEEYPDALLFFRLGDFYEMFFDDAITASRELELTLTGRDCGLDERAPMCGVPWHAADGYIARLVERGYKVAICEQTEDPALVKGLVKRAVVRVVTPGTVSDLGALNERRNNFIAAVHPTGNRVGVAWCDVTTGEFLAQVLNDPAQELGRLLTMISPSEVVTSAPELVNKAVQTFVAPYPAACFAAKAARDQVLRHFEVSHLGALGLTQSDAPATAAAGALLHYLNDMQKAALPHITALKLVTGADSMPLDVATRRNLELTEGLRSRSVQGSLLWLLDSTVTAMGARQLRLWVEQPLTQKDAILTRQAQVAALYNNTVAGEELVLHLKQVYDMERLLSRVSYGTLNARDCVALKRTLQQLPPVRALLLSLQDESLQPLLKQLDPWPEVADLLERAIEDDPPITTTEGGMIRDGYDAALDEARQASRQGAQWLLDLEAREREATGIKNLRVQYNRVFGYFLEVTKSNYALVPDHYVRRQTLANVERYTTEELRALEQRVLGAQGEAITLESTLFEGIRAELLSQLPALQRTAQGLKAVDALLSLARVARDNGYVRPTLNEAGTIDIVDGRHPVVEKTLGDGSFVPNDTHMNPQDKRMLIVTGPNMAGKSTYMRQTALIVLMAHMGSFVPAASADIPLVDAIFTRIGASDDLAGGQSTFMVEMTELAYIMRTATANSLVILDEIGRGTSTFDGLAIAWATVEYLADTDRCGAKTLFATHYHELSELEGVLEGVENHCVSVKEMGDEVIFLRKIMRGGADKSFGVHVTRMAGLPRSVTARAREIQARLEVSNINQNAIGRNILEKGNRRVEQVQLMEYGKTELIEELRQMDVLAMSPMDALNALFLLREKARKL